MPPPPWALKDDASEVRMESAKALGLFKRDADSAVAALKDAFSKETVVEVKAEMEKAINAIESDVKSMQEKEKTEDKPKG
jgi:DNA polymerase III delta prime subunit